MEKVTFISSIGCAPHTWGKLRSLVSRNVRITGIWIREN